MMENDQNDTERSSKNKLTKHVSEFDAIRNIKKLYGRDITYQYEVIKEYRVSAANVAIWTNDEIQVSRDCVEFCKEWLRDYPKNNREEENLPYLSLETISAFRPLAKEYGISTHDDFYQKYKACNGEYEGLRVSQAGEEYDDDSSTWDRLRNLLLRPIINDINSNKINLYETPNADLPKMPSREHTACIVLGYSPEPEKIEALIPTMLKHFNRKEDNPKADEQQQRSTNKASDSFEKQIVEEKKSCKIFLYKIKALMYYDVTHGLKHMAKYYLISKKHLKTAEDKLQNIKEAMKIYDDWLHTYVTDGREKENKNYLPIEIIEAFRPLAIKYELFMYRDFYEKYKEAKGDYRKLRTVKTQMDLCEMDTWDVLRNEWLDSIIKNIEKNSVWWYEKVLDNRDSLPSREHTRCILLGYSPDPEKLRKIIPTLEKLLTMIMLKNRVNETSRRK